MGDKCHMVFSQPRAEADSTVSVCRILAERFRNGDMCRLTEQVIFTDPYYAAPVNSHTPQIDALACALRTDQEAKIAVANVKVLCLYWPFFTGCMHVDM